MSRWCAKFRRSSFQTVLSEMIIRILIYFLPTNHLDQILAFLPWGPKNVLFPSCICKAWLQLHRMQPSWFPQELLIQLWWSKLHELAKANLAVSIHNRLHLHEGTKMPFAQDRFPNVPDENMQLSWERHSIWLHSIFIPGQLKLARPRRMKQSIRRSLLWLISSLYRRI